MLKEITRKLFNMSVSRDKDITVVITLLPCACVCADVCIYVHVSAYLTKKREKGTE